MNYALLFLDGAIQGHSGVCVWVLQSVCCLGHTVNADSRPVNAFHRDYDSWGTVLCGEVKLKGRFAKNWQQKKKMCVSGAPSFSSLIHHTNKNLGDWWRGFLQTPSRVRRLSVSVDLLTAQKGKKEEISTSGRAPSSYLFDVRPWDMSVLFMWGNILQWNGDESKYQCFNVAILTLFCVFIYTHQGLRMRR